MRLNELLGGEATALVAVKKSAEIDIVGLTVDSRQVRAGYLFAALPGSIQSAGDTLFTSGSMSRYSKILNAVIESPGGLYRGQGPGAGGQ